MLLQEVATILVKEGRLALILHFILLSIVVVGYFTILYAVLTVVLIISFNFMLKLNFLIQILPFFEVLAFIFLHIPISVSIQLIVFIDVPFLK